MLGRRRPVHRPVARQVGAALLLALIATIARAETDLSVGLIERLPKIDYVWDSPNPKVDGWPARGDLVTWVAHVRNLGREHLEGVEYRWLLGGEIVAEGKADLRRRKVTLFELEQKWKPKRRELVFEIDPRDLVPESEERNNELLIHTDALGVGIWVEKRFWKSIRATVQRAGIGCTTFEDWMQRRVRQFNQMAALAIYPETPRGVRDRWRIDAIHVVPHRALPLSPPDVGVQNSGVVPRFLGALYPDSSDRTVDMQWGFPDFTRHWFTDNQAWSLLNDSLIHELGHARYLVDVYAWNVTRDDEITISPPLPANQYGFLHATPEHGLMNTNWGFIDRYSAIALNKIAGHRATQGNYNAPANFGVFLNDLPAESSLRIRAPDGSVFPRRQVRIYRASGEPEADWLSNPYRLKIDGEPDLELETDAEGSVLLPRNPFSDQELVLEPERNNTLAIVEVVDGSDSHWGYLELRELNLAYWRGETEHANLDLVVDAPVCPNPGLGPDDITPSHSALAESCQVTVEWPTLGERRFELWYSVEGGRPKRRVVEAAPSDERASETLQLRGDHVAWWLVYDDSRAAAQCPALRTTIYFFDLPKAC